MIEFERPDAAAQIQEVLVAAELPKSEELQALEKLLEKKLQQLAHLGFDVSDIQKNETIH